MNLNLLGNLSFKVSLIKWPTVDGRRITVKCTHRSGQAKYEVWILNLVRQGLSVVSDWFTDYRLSAIDKTS